MYRHSPQFPRFLIEEHISLQTVSTVFAKLQKRAATIVILEHRFIIYSVITSMRRKLSGNCCICRWTKKNSLLTNIHIKYSISYRYTSLYRSIYHCLILLAVAIFSD